MTSCGRVRFDFSGAEILITGGSSGIGLATARAFARAGAAVTVTGTRRAASEYAEDLSAFTYRPCDLGDVAQIEALAGGTGKLDILVNNAGTAMRGPDPHDPDEFEAVIDVNLNAVYRLSRLLHPKLKARPGAIVNIGSLYAYYGAPNVPGYGASKAAIVELTMSLAALWAGDGIRVNNVAPGWTATRMTEKRRADAAMNQTVLQRTPLGRWGQPEDVADAALFLASDAARFITGVTLPVDGGFATS
jgi:3-oxoacyl-[acyl-carrier protein] reductase